MNKNKEYAYSIMELQSIIEKRQSIRRYKDRLVPKSDMIEIVRAAGLAPSGKNIQNWHFAVITNQDLKDKIGEAITAKNDEIAARLESVDTEKAERFRKFCRNFTMFAIHAPVLTVIFSTDYLPSGYNELKSVDASDQELFEIMYKRNPGMQSLGAAIENFTLKAIDLGYGSCWLTSANYASCEIEKLFKAEGVFDRDGWYMAAMIALGVPEENQKSPQKKPLDDIMTFID